jgi:hypothetical protein
VIVFICVTSVGIEHFIFGLEYYISASKIVDPEAYKHRENKIRCIFWSIIFMYTLAEAFAVTVE